MTDNENTPRSIVVVAFAEALAAPEVVWSLIDSGFAVIGVKRRGKPVALSHSRLVSIREIAAPESDIDLAHRALVDLLTELHARGAYERHVLLPMDDTAVWLCGSAAREAGWTYAGPIGADALVLALDKRRQVRLARDADLSVPTTVVATSADDLRSLPFGFPLILRPAEAVRLADRQIRKGRNWICSDRDELDAASHAWAGDGPMLVQPYIDGVGEGVFGLMTDRGVIGWSAHRRLRMMNPHGSGSSACISRAVDEDVKGPITKFLQSSGWRGLFMVEMLRGADGSLHFVEFNGRAWGSMALARRMGLEYPAWAVRQALGEASIGSTVPPAREGVVCRNVGRELMHLLFVLRGRRSRAMRRWPSFWSALRDVLGPQPGGSFYNWRRDDWRVFASDCYYTISRNVSKRWL